MDSGCPCDFATISSKESRAMNTIEQKQTELGLEKARASASAQRPKRRLNRASWWFQQMRDVVDKAADWRPIPSADAKQIHFPE